LLVCLPALLYVGWWATTKWSPARQILLRRLTASFAALIVAAGLTAWYNHRVFGSAVTLPYQVNRATYAMAPVFLWLSPKPEPAYRYRVMRNFYTGWEMRSFSAARTLPGLPSEASSSHPSTRATEPCRPSFRLRSAPAE